MYAEPIFLQPVFKDRIWGGTKLRETFGYQIPSETTGECWGISAHTNGPSTILNGPLKGLTLDEAWQKHRGLFAGQEGDDFPLLVKILDAKTDLSVQVHPDDEYAQRVEHEAFGKTECWYIIDCEEGSELVYGHHAKSKDEFQAMVDNGQWDKLLRKIKIQPGDFVYVPNGTIHAIGAGTMILETQQSSDVTYRVYDYDRKDAQGNTRDLHIKQSIEVAMIPHEDAHFQPVENKQGDLTVKKLIKESYFTVYHWALNGTALDLENPMYLLVSVLDGEGEIETQNGTSSFKKGDHFIVPSTVKKFSLKGNASFITSHSS
ncbi:mannose-6-phosphate isomerase, class I [Fictibacillus sp. WQ 8-8]|uniref:mannose-6-phosphate isomerase, class I n=1 Tax=Fictibacillus sp. WQ 8-8 TaxID=2938788 RepID=UPI0006A79DC2|nr:mannose-6-phosphate isomerase, class I [Fictibacillus sp. WQ 8-8]MCQ6264829.1 mannose-6-phosphate isomerase, class I [Fictibacillus sp. WQ 8-8]SFE87628.1 mannose-6-phosphate isomerase, type 1 [Bacillus sp. OV194]